MSTDEHVVQRWLDRGQKFFRAVTRNPYIKSNLLSRGLTQEELGVGWGYYSRLLGFEEKANEDKPALASEPSTINAEQAMVKLDAWDAPSYAAIHAVTEHRWPAVTLHLFDGVSADTGPRAVAGVERFLANYAQLVNGTAKEVNAEDGAKAVALLQTRQLISPGIADQLSTLVKIAQSGATPIDLSERPEEEIEAAFLRYKNWLHEWREVARNSIQRRDYHIALGLATRRTRSNRNDDSDDAPDDDDNEERT